jgi:hypothetical protein
MVIHAALAIKVAPNTAARLEFLDIILSFLSITKLFLLLFLGFTSKRGRHC